MHEYHLNASIYAEHACENEINEIACTERQTVGERFSEWRWADQRPNEQSWGDRKLFISIHSRAPASCFRRATERNWYFSTNFHERRLLCRSFYSIRSICTTTRSTSDAKSKKKETDCRGPIEVRRIHIWQMRTSYVNACEIRRDCIDAKDENRFISANWDVNCSAQWPSEAHEKTK